MKLNRFVKSTGIYFIGNVLSKIAVFLLLPLYTSYIEPEAMGLYDTGVTIITLFASMLFLDIGSVILKFSLDKECNDVRFPITNGCLIFLASCILYLLLLITCRLFFRYEYFGWIILYGFTYALNTAVGYVARALKYNTDYAISGVLQTILMIVLNIVMLIGFKLDYKVLYISFSISSLLSSIYLFFRARIYKYLSRLFFRKEKFLEMFRFSLPLCVNSIAFWLLSSSSRIIVTSMLGASATGYLSVANKFNQILYLVSTCVHLTWQEAAFAHDNTGEKDKQFYSNIFIVYYKVVLFCVAALILIVKIGLSIFPTFIDSAYSESINLIPMALLGTGLAIISQFLGTIFSSLKKTSIIFLSTLAGAITTVSTTFVFIRLNCGPASANYSFIAGYLITIIIRVVLLKKYINLKCKFQYLLFLIPILFVAVGAYVNLEIYTNIIVLIILIAIIPILFTREFSILRRKNR